MCIRDSLYVSQPDTGEQALEIADALIRSGTMDVVVIDSVACLLYTSDAADERSSVDLGGRRIITKKNRERNSRPERA